MPPAAPLLRGADRGVPPHAAGALGFSRPFHARITPALRSGQKARPQRAEGRDPRPTAKGAPVYRLAAAHGASWAKGAGRRILPANASSSASGGAALSGAASRPRVQVRALPFRAAGGTQPPSSPCAGGGLHGAGFGNPLPANALASGSRLAGGGVKRWPGGPSPSQRSAATRAACRVSYRLLQLAPWPRNPARCSCHCSVSAVARSSSRATADARIAVPLPRAIGFRR